MKKKISAETKRHAKVFDDASEYFDRRDNDADQKHPNDIIVGLNESVPKGITEKLKQLKKKTAIPKAIPPAMELKKKLIRLAKSDRSGMKLKKRKSKSKKKKK